MTLKLSDSLDIDYNVDAVTLNTHCKQVMLSDQTKTSHFNQHKHGVNKRFIV